MVALPKLMQGQCSDVYDTMSAEGCNHYEWQGRVLTTSGNYDDTVANAVAGGCDSLLTLRLTIYRCITPPNPDNMDSSQCVKMLDAREWSIQNSWSSGGGVSNHNTPMVGDLDDDGVPDIMCFGSSGEHDNNGLRDCTVLVYDGITKRQKANFRMPVYVTAYDAGAYGLVKLPSRKGLIIMAGIDCYLRAFDITSANPATPYWTSNEPYGTGNQFAVNVSFADFNNDGHPEIVVRNKIFDAATGVLLTTTTGGNNTGASYAHYSHRTGRTLYSPMVANLLGDDRQELILGNEIYDIRITNRSGTAGNSATLIKRINPPTSVVQDGHAQVADFNLDGHLDIFVSNKDVVGGGGTVSMYVWDVHNNRTSPAVRIPCNMSGKSLPLIANIDTDDNLEVAIQCAASGVGNQRVRTYKYNAESNQFDFMWGIGVDEDSYSNGMTAFDFNLDGVNEMLICDQSTMRVVNGAGQVMNSFRFSETTIMQYPVIADVDCDGHAEVVSVGSGRLNIFKSSGQPWAPARSVWNQYMYNITCVNNDLTVPRYYYNNATALTDPDDGTIRRPYNNFLQQTTSMDQYGRPFYGLPDVTVSQFSALYSDHAIHIDATYTNQGSLGMAAPFYITLYARTAKDSVIEIRRINTQLMKDSSERIVFSLPIDNACLLPFEGVTLSLNDDGTRRHNSANSQEECDTSNNEFYIVLPTSEARHIYIDTQQCDTFRWAETGKRYETSGEYSYTVAAHDGCDSTRTLRLRVPYSFDDTTRVAACDTYTWPVNGKSYSTTANDVDSMMTIDECDSVWHLDLTVNYSHKYHPCDTVSDTTLPYYFIDRSYTHAVRNDRFHYTTVHGCDSDYYFSLYIDYHRISCDGWLQFPTLITPNGDGINDRFVIKGLLEQDCYPTNELAIYNRWGMCVYRRRNIARPDDFWRPEGLPTGTYFYSFIGRGASQDVERHGVVELLNK